MPQVSAAWVPNPRRVLEVGCGEGAVSERLVALYPNAEITAIDITPNVGRLYAGPLGRVRFAETTIQAFAAKEQGKFDLIVLADVMSPRHRPVHCGSRSWRQSSSSWPVTAILLSRSGRRTPTPIHWLGYLSDRWITGRPHLLYGWRGDLRPAEGRIRVRLHPGGRACAALAQQHLVAGSAMKVGASSPCKPRIVGAT